MRHVELDVWQSKVVTGVIDTAKVTLDWIKKSGVALINKHCLANGGVFLWSERSVLSPCEGL